MIIYLSNGRYLRAQGHRIILSMNSECAKDVSPTNSLRRFIEKSELLYATAFHHAINGSSISGKFLELPPEKSDAPSTNCASDSIEPCMKSTYTKK